MTKQCTTCEETKLINNFCKSKSGKHGVGSVCRPCKSKVNLEWSRKNPDKCKKYRQKTRKVHPEADRGYYLKRDFNLTIQEYNKLLKKQSFCCAICKKPQSEFKINLAVDHCHTTGKVRGLLCNVCNIGLGYFKDKKQLLFSAIEYLNNTSSEDGSNE